MYKHVLRLGFSVFFTLPLFAQNPWGTCYLGSSVGIIEGENVKGSFYNQGGVFSSFPTPSGPGFEWPKNSSKSMIFMASQWFAGVEKSTGTRKLVVSTPGYPGNNRLYYWPGPVGDSVPDTTECGFWNRHFAVSRPVVQLFQSILMSTSLPIPEAMIPEKIRNWPGTGNPFLLADAQARGYSPLSDFMIPLAPFVDHDGDGIYNPSKGDYPDLQGKETALWWIMNDVGNKKGNTANPELPINVGLQFQAMAYTYPVQNGQHYLANALFLELSVYNRRTLHLDSCYFGFWADTDLGNPNDDYVQCDVIRNLGITYNSDSLDEGTNGYGLNPPALAFKAIDGPVAFSGDGIDNDRDGLVDEAGEKNLLSSFMCYKIGNDPVTGEPSQYSHYYNLLQGKRINGSPVLLPPTVGAPSGVSTKYFFPAGSDPIGYGLGGTPQNPLNFPWSERSLANPRGDRQFLMCAGPFNLPPGGFERYTIVNMIGSGGTNLENLDQLASISDSMDQYFGLTTRRANQLSQEPNTLLLSPNPGTGNVLVECSLPMQRLQIQDVQGKLVWETMPQNRLASLDAGGLLPGVYYIRSFTRQGVLVKKWVKL